MSAASTFNVLLQQMVEELCKVYPGDAKLKLCATALKSFSSGESEVGLAAWRNTLGPHGHLITARDAALFDACPKLPGGLDLRAIWHGNLSPSNQAVMWEYITCLHALASAHQGGAAAQEQAPGLPAGLDLSTLAGVLPKELQSALGGVNMDDVMSLAADIDQEALMGLLAGVDLQGLLAGGGITPAKLHRLAGSIDRNKLMGLVAGLDQRKLARIAQGVDQGKLLKVLGKHHK